MTSTQKTSTTTKTASKKKESGKKQSTAKTGKAIADKKQPAAKNKTAMAPAKPVEIIDRAKYSKRLEESTGKIRKEINSIGNSFCKIGFELYQVREQKLYLGLDFKNVVEYAESVFKFQKSSVSNYISICERFSVHKNGKPTAQLLPEFESFNYGQLSIMLALPANKVKEITPDKTCFEIREIKRDSKSSSGSAPASATGSDNRIEYVVAWHYNNEPVPLKTVFLKISPDKTDKIYKEICVLLNNDWTDFGRDGDSLTVGLVNKSGGDSN